jgi:hypothetical protein
MCDYNLYFWHHEFGTVGTLNDISIWISAVSTRILLMELIRKIAIFHTQSMENNLTSCGSHQSMEFTPKLSLFVKTLSQPVDKKQANYAKWQEKTRKDVERSFGILQSKFRILTQNVELWSIKDIVFVG